MTFNLDTGKVDGSGSLWRADDWIHMNIPGGMLSMLMPEKELLFFIEFLAHIPLHKNGYEMRSKRYHYQSEDHDEGHVNVFIGDNTLVIININMEHIPALMSYLYDRRDECKWQDEQIAKEITAPL